MSRGRVFSGIQPTGMPHLGNYLGALKNWKRLSKENECFFSIVDLHAMTTFQSASDLNKNTLQMATLLYALDLQHANVFIQSQVPQHAELSWLLNCFTPFGMLTRMTQWKSKQSLSAGHSNLGLFSYPVLQCADILLYKAEFVPVGRDQEQHLELARYLASHFNSKVGFNFPLPKPLFLENDKILSLRDPTKKMSKSDQQPHSAIYLSDSLDLITKKIKKSVTDSQPTIQFDPENRPGLSNLMKIYSSLTEKSIQDCEKEFENLQMKEFKEALIDVIWKEVEPIQQKMKQVEPEELTLFLEKGKEAAHQVASQTMKEVKMALGLHYKI